MWHSLPDCSKRLAWASRRSVFHSSRCAFRPVHARLDLAVDLVGDLLPRVSDRAHGGGNDEFGLDATHGVTPSGDVRPALAGRFETCFPTPEGTLTSFLERVKELVYNISLFVVSDVLGNVSAMSFLSLPRRGCISQPGVATKERTPGNVRDKRSSTPTGLYHARSTNARDTTPLGLEYTEPLPGVRSFVATPGCEMQPLRGKDNAAVANSPTSVGRPI